MCSCRIIIYVYKTWYIQKVKIHCTGLSTSLKKCPVCTPPSTPLRKRLLSVSVSVSEEDVDITNMIFDKSDTTYQILSWTAYWQVHVHVGLTKKKQGTILHLQCCSAPVLSPRLPQHSLTAFFWEPDQVIGTKVEGLGLKIKDLIG